MNKRSILKRISRKIKKLLESTDQGHILEKQRKKSAIQIGRRLNLKKNDYIYNEDALKPSFYLPLYKTDYIQQEILTNANYYEYENLYYISKEWENGQLTSDIKDGCLLDIGANIGNHTLFFFFECGIGTAICFEPIVDTFQILNRNIIANNLAEKVTLHNCAVGDKEGLASVVYFDKKNIGATQIGIDHDGQIPMITIDSLHLKDPIKIIKIDVEGFEKSVLKGCQETIIKNKPYILIEIQPENLDEITKMLCNIGYSYVKLEGINYLFYKQ